MQVVFNPVMHFMQQGRFFFQRLLNNPALVFLQRPMSLTLLVVVVLVLVAPRVAKQFSRRAKTPVG